MGEINPVPIILQARAVKRPLNFSFHEIDYVCHSTGLSLLEKQIWWLLAVETNLDPQLACLLSYQQIAYTLQMDYPSVHRALHRLVRMGFIQVNDLPRYGKREFTPDELLYLRLFMLSLPYEGLLMLKKTPSYQPSKPYQQGIFRKPSIALNLLKKYQPPDSEEEGGD